MADSKELQTQLQLNQQINKVLADRAKLISSATGQLSSQAKMAKELCSAMECRDLEGLEERIENISDAMNDAADSAAAAGEAMNGLGESGKKSAGGLGSAFGGVLDKITPMKGAAVGAGMGFLKGFGGVTGMLGMIGGGLKSVVGGLMKVGKSVLAVPFKILGGFVDAAASGSGGVNELRQSMEKLKGEMGDLATGEGKAVMDGFDALRGSSSALAKSGLSVGQVFGYGNEGAAKMLEAVGEIAKAAGPAFSMLGETIAGAADKMVMMNKGLGMTNEALAEMARKAHNSGKDVGQELVDMGSMAIQMGAEFGVSAKTIGKNMSSLTEDVASFGNMSRKELGATATYMAKLGLEAKDLQGVIGKFDDFEGAADSVSQLNQAFGIQLDTMEMMNAQNPAERIDMMKDAFHDAGKSVDDMTRSEKALMAEQMGLSVSAMENVLAAENQGVAYEDMEAAAEEAEANKMTEKEVMLELAKSVEKLVKGGEGVKGFFDAFSKGFSRGFKQNKEYIKSISNIRQSFEKVGKFGKELGVMFGELMQKMGLFKAIQKIFDPKAIGKLLDGIMGHFKKFKKSTESGGTYSLKDMISDIFNDVKNYLTKGAGGEGASAFAEFFANAIRGIGDGLAAALPFILEKVAAFVQFLADAINDPSSMSKALGGGGGGGIGAALADSFSKIGEALKPVLPQLLDAFKNLFGALYDKLAPIIGFGLKSVIKIAIIKAVVSALASAVTNAAIVGGVKLFAKLFSGGMGKSVGKSMNQEMPKSMKKGGGGMFSSMKGMFDAIGQIKMSSVIKAGAIMVVLAAFMGIAMVAFAGGLKLATMVLKGVGFMEIVKVVGGVTFAMLAMTPLLAAALLIPAPLIVPAGVSMLLLAAFFSGAMIIFAAGIRLAYEIMKPVAWADFGKMMGMVYLSIVATAGLAAAGAGMALLLPFIPAMIVGLIAAAGLFTAGVAIFAKAITISLPTFKKLAQNEKAISFSIGAIIDIVKTVALLGVLGTAFAAIGIFVFVLKKGFKIAAGFFLDTVVYIEQMVKAIMKIPITNPDDVGKRIYIVGKIAETMQVIGKIGLDAGKMALAAERMKEGGMAEMFNGMSQFLNTISGILVSLITLIVNLASGLDESQMEGVEVIAGVLDAVAGLAGALFSPLEAVSKMSSGMFGPSVTEVMSAVTAGLQQLMLSILVVLPLLVSQLITIASGIKDPKTLKPKMDIVSGSLQAVASFASAIEVVAKLMPEKGGIMGMGGASMKERIADMTEKISGVVDAVQAHIGRLVRSITKINLGGDPAAIGPKIDIIAKAMGAVADFATVVEKLSGMEGDAESMPIVVSNVISGIVNSLVHPSNYDFNNLFKTLSTFEPDGSQVEKLSTATDALNGMSNFYASAQKASGIFTAGEWDIGIVVADMIRETQAAITALNSVGDLNVVAAMDNFAQAIGTGGGEFNITNEPVNITLNVQVTMDADKVGKVLVDKSVMTTALATAEG